MSQPNRRRMKLETMHAQRMEAQGARYFELELDDEQVLKFLRQPWWPLDLVKEFQEMQKGAASEELSDEEAMASGLDFTVAMFRRVCTDKEVFDAFRKEMSLGDLEDLMKEIAPDLVAKDGQGESPSSSE
jgi:hypothetical protein